MHVILVTVLDGEYPESITVLERASGGLQCCVDGPGRRGGVCVLFCSCARVHRLQPGFWMATVCTKVWHGNRAGRSLLLLVIGGAGWTVDLLSRGCSRLSAVVAEEPLLMSDSPIRRAKHVLPKYHLTATFTVNTLVGRVTA